jgi:hypothetical protein
VGLTGDRTRSRIHRRLRIAVSHPGAPAAQKMEMAVPTVMLT